MSNTTDKYIIITFSIVNNPYPCYPYMFTTENYFSKFTIMSFWARVLKFPAENGIPKKISGYCHLRGYWSLLILSSRMDIEIAKIN